MHASTTTKHGDQVRKRVCKTLRDIQDLQKRWDDINSRGAELANNLVNTHLRVQYLPVYKWGYFEACPGITAKTREKFIKSIELEHKALIKNLDDLTYIHNKMASFVESLQSLLTYLKETETCKPLLEEPLFVTLLVPQFVSLSEECLEMYAKELAVKTAILGDILKITNRDLLAVYVSTWTLQPSKQLEYFNAAISQELGLSEEM